MCSPKTPSAPPAPKIQEPPPAPPPPEPTPEAPVTEEGVKRTGAKSKQKAARKGTSALKIDINLAQPGGKGLNIPRG